MTYVSTTMPYVLYSGIGIHLAFQNSISPTTMTIPGTVLGSRLNKSTSFCPGRLERPTVNANQVPSTTAIVDATTARPRLFKIALRLSDPGASRSA